MTKNLSVKLVSACLFVVVSNHMASAQSQSLTYQVENRFSYVENKVRYSDDIGLSKQLNCTACSPSASQQVLIYKNTKGPLVTVSPAPGAAGGTRYSFMTYSSNHPGKLGYRFGCVFNVTLRVDTTGMICSVDTYVNQHEYSESPNQCQYTVTKKGNCDYHVDFLMDG